MLTISISEALQGPAAWSQWGSAGNEVIGSEEAWQQQVSAEWELEALAAASDLSLADLCNPALWTTPWPAETGLQEAWEQELIASEAAAALALATAISVAAPVLSDEGDAVQGREAAWASPLRVPLPAPLAVEPLSELELGGFELIELPMESTFSEPQKLSVPPSLLGHAGSGSLSKDSPPAAATAAVPAQKPAATAPAPQAPPGMGIEMPQGMVIGQSEVGGRACTRVDWKIDDFSGKLQASMGRPVVSPAFGASGLSNLRLMVFPDARDAVKRARGFERKALYANMVKQGPLYGSLKLKADGLERATVMTFCLLVGGVRAGPTTYDFSEQAVLGLDDFGVDWLQQVDKKTGAITVGIEIIEVHQK